MRIDATTRAFVTGASRGHRPGGRRGARRARRDGRPAARGAERSWRRWRRELGPRARRAARRRRRPRAGAAAVERFIEHAGGLDLVVANAGIAHYGRFLDQDLELHERMTRVNWLGTVYTVGRRSAHLVDRGRGHVVIVSSGAGLRAFP